MSHSALDELREVEALLASAADDGAVGYAGGRLMMAGLEQRRSRLLSEHFSRAAVATEQLDLGLTRAPECGTGAELGLVAGVLDAFQESLASIAQGIQGHATARGVIPGSIQERVGLRVALALPGSLNLRLVPASVPRQGEIFDDSEDGTLLDLSLDRLFALVDQARGGREAAFELVAEVGPRASSHLHALTKRLVDADAELDMHWRAPKRRSSAKLDREAARSLRQVLEEVQSETRTRIHTGRIVGANLVRRTFDLQLEEADGTVISGKVREDDALDDVQILFGEICTATVEVRESRLRSGETREHFVLLSVTD